MTKKQKKKLALALQEKGHWRVKELLQSYISGLEYDKETYFEYAKILHHYGDFVQSGKYFFLCDTSIEKYKKAIDMYLLRNTYKKILHDTPRQFKKLYTKNKRKHLNNKDENNVSNVVGTSILIFILSVFFIGLFTIASYILNFIMSSIVKIT